MCTVTFGGKKARNAWAKLTRGGHTYASGWLTDLDRTRTIRHGSYVLHLTIDGHTLSIPVRLG
jgi:hypothetical protein